MVDRLRLSRRKGFRLPAGAVNVARPSRWGNRFKIGQPHLVHGWPMSAGEATACMKRWLLDTAEGQSLLAAARVELRGKPLACWCALPSDGEPDPCHAQMWIELVSPPVYRLTVTAEQLRTLQIATEMLMRVGMGQFDLVAEWSPLAVDAEAKHADGCARWHTLKDELRRLERLALPGLPDGGHPGPGHPMANPQSGRACDLHQVIRHRLAWDRAGNPPLRDWSTMLGVDFDEPRSCTGEALAMVEVAR